MFKKVLKWLGIVLGAVIVIVVAATGILYVRSNRIINRVWDVPESPALWVKDDSASVERGRHLATAMAGCVVCHGEKLSGDVIVDDAAFARIYAPNITAGKGGVTGNYATADFERTLRHGVKPDGHGVFIMPSYHYCYLSDEDAAAVIGYVTQAAPVDSAQPKLHFGPVGRMLLLQKKVMPTSASPINHRAARPSCPRADTTAAYGQYMVRVGCIGCHNPDMSGGTIVDSPPDWPPAANLTGGGVLRNYDYAQFVRTLRTGKRAGGNALSDVMPWKYMGQQTNDELTAVWLCLQSLPAKPTGSASWMNYTSP